MTSQENAKKRAGYLAADLIKTHTRVGVGTGSTVAYFIERLVERTQKENLQIFAAASSLATMALLQKARISLIPEDQMKRSEKQIQEMTDKFCKDVDTACVDKEKEIMTV